MISTIDISPNARNGIPGAGASPAGVIKGLAGDGHETYAVSANAGIWKSVGDGPWQQLPNSPPRAFCIAQDPNNPAHLIVGERATEAIKPQPVGVWESLDAGANWNYLLNPLIAPATKSQGVAAVLFSTKSTALVGTQGAIGRRPVGRASFDFTANPLGQFPGERLTAFASSESNDVYLEERLAGVSATGDVLLCSWTPKLDWRVTDLTTATGIRAASAPTSWQTQDGPYNVEHLAFTDAGGHVVVLISSERGDWHVVDVTAVTGQTIQGPLTSWQTASGPYNVEHLAGINSAGDVIVFWWSPAHDWQFTNVSTKTGQQINTPLTSWQTPNGPDIVEHLAGVNSSGDVIVFWWSPKHDWQSVNVSVATGQQVATALTNWQTPNGPFLVEHLAGVSAAGRVLVFLWSPAHDWQAIDVTTITGQTIQGPLTSWQTPNGPYNVEHLAGISPSGHALVFLWSPVHDWQFVDVTAKTGQVMKGPLVSWQTPNGPYNVEHLGGLTASGDVVVFWWSPAQDWQAIDVSRVTGVGQVSQALTSWQVAKRLQFLWARTRNRLFFSWDDGSSWSERDFVLQIAIPTTMVGGVTVPGGTYNVTTSKPSDPGGDDSLGLAAVDTTAYVMCKLHIPGVPHKDDDPTGNRSVLLIHEFLTGRWSVQILNSGDGTGLGGRRFLHSYIIGGSGAAGGIGGRVHLFACTADDVLYATGVGNLGIDWTLFASTTIGARASDQIHSDMWDFLFSPDGKLAWVACDGGVFRASVPTPYSPGLLAWQVWNDGLHTHHVHDLTAIEVDATHRSKLAYPTQDNDGWYRDSSLLGGPAPSWLSTNSLGDASWTVGAGDPGIAIIARRLGFAALVVFGDPLPPGANFTEGAVIAIRSDIKTGVDGPLAFQCIQTLQGESPTYPLLDVVMLADLPLVDTAGNPVPGPLGVPEPSGLPVLVRNKRLAAAPSVGSLFADWIIEARNLPAGTRGFWVASGHVNPVYYAYAPLAGSLTLFKRAAGNVWNALPIAGLSDGSLHGPCFVNPYDANVIYALTPSGVMVSKDGGATIAIDAELTGLISGGGRFPISGAVDVSFPFYELGGRPHSPLVMATLSHMAFLQEDSTQVVAASPFSGVFYNNGTIWKDLSGFLPKPLALVSAVAIDSQSIYVAFEGRSIIQLEGFNT
jgi:hypothetical protein